MAKPITKARKDASFQQVLKVITDVPEVPAWPFKTITPEEWNAVPARIRKNYEGALAYYIEETRAAR